MRRFLNTAFALGYKRWRHGRGFGIHSPFAYDLIVNTLRQKLPYYKYKLIDRIVCADMTASRLKLIFRLVVRFQPANVTIMGLKGLDSIRQTIILADSRIVFSEESPDMVIVCQDANAIPQYVQAKIYLFIGTACRSEQCDAVWQSVQRGQRFDNGRDCSLIVRSSKFPRQQFDVKY